MVYTYMGNLKIGVPVWIDMKGNVMTKEIRPKYRRLESGEIIQEGDEYDNCIDAWKDDAVWIPATDVGKKAPNPRYVSHRKYRRRIDQ